MDMPEVVVAFHMEGMDSALALDAETVGPSRCIHSPLACPLLQGHSSLVQQLQLIERNHSEWNVHQGHPGRREHSSASRQTHQVCPSSGSMFRHGPVQHLMSTPLPLHRRGSRLLHRAVGESHQLTGSVLMNSLWSLVSKAEDLS